MPAKVPVRLEGGAPSAVQLVLDVADVSTLEDGHCGKERSDTDTREGEPVGSDIADMSYHPHVRTLLDEEGLFRTASNGLQFELVCSVGGCEGVRIGGWW
jgi:hypothetical protein